MKKKEEERRDSRMYMNNTQRRMKRDTTGTVLKDEGRVHVY